MHHAHFATSACRGRYRRRRGGGRCGGARRQPDPRHSRLHLRTSARRLGGKGTPMTSPVTATETTEVAAEQSAREAALTERVLHSFDACAQPRLRDVMQALVRHLHDFLREVRLTEEEWAAGIDVSDRRRAHHRRPAAGVHPALRCARRVDADHHDQQCGPWRRHRSDRFRPILRRGRPRVELGGDITFGAAGEPCWVEGTVTDVGGNPLPGARIDVWEADEDGFYDVQYDDERTAARGHLFAGADGVMLLGTDTHAIPDPIRRPGGPDAGGDRALTDARIAPALHGQRARISHAGDAHLRARRRTAGPRHVFGVRTR